MASILQVISLAFLLGRLWERHVPAQNKSHIDRLVRGWQGEWMGCDSEARQRYEDESS